MISVSDDDVINAVRVVSGALLADFDTTGTLTQKFQAKIDPGEPRAELLSGSDTLAFGELLTDENDAAQLTVGPSSEPEAGSLLPIHEIFARLETLIGTKVEHLGATQERNRGSEIHRVVCQALGYQEYEDDGRFPDVRHQLLEVKLQTAGTIDLGLVAPNSDEYLDAAPVSGRLIRHCDVRYAILCGDVDGDGVRVTHVLVTTGEDFSDHFTQFGGKVVNKKLQIPLPTDFFG